MKENWPPGSLDTFVGSSICKEENRVLLFQGESRAPGHAEIRGGCRPVNQCEGEEDCPGSGKGWARVSLPLTFGRAGGQFRTRAGQKVPFLGSNKTLRGKCVYWKRGAFVSSDLSLSRENGEKEMATHSGILA